MIFTAHFYWHVFFKNIALYEMQPHHQSYSEIYKRINNNKKSGEENLKKFLLKDIHFQLSSPK